MCHVCSLVVCTCKQPVGSEDKMENAIRETSFVLGLHRHPVKMTNRLVEYTAKVRISFANAVMFFFPFFLLFFEPIGIHMCRLSNVSPFVYRPTPDA